MKHSGLINWQEGAAMAEQYTFTVNGKRVSTSKQTSMLRFLRDELHLHSVKDGCSEGACGACMILVDGKPTRACVLKTQRAVGKEIVTVEGLTDLEKEAFVYAFGVSGSVQCGFCTPGMVISAAGLLRQNPDPTDEEIKTAIRGNLCRCTGYRKIIEGIRLAGQVLRGVKQIDYEPEQEDYGRVGTRTFRVDVRKKVLGTGKYPDDIEIEDVWQNLNRAYGLEEDVPYRRRSSELSLPEESGKAVSHGTDACEAGSHGADVCSSDSRAQAEEQESARVRAALARRDSSIYDGSAENRSDVYGFDASSMAYASCVRAAYPRAVVRRIDLSEARQVPGVIGILTAADVPHNKVGHIQQDWDVMIAEGDTTRMVGDAICLVVAENRDALEEAKKLVHVDYEVLEPVRDIDEARRPDAPKIHEEGNLCQSRHVTRGDAKRALKASKYTVTETFETPFTEHAFLEPECAVAFPYKNGVKILSTDQGALRHKARGRDHVRLGSGACGRRESAHRRRLRRQGGCLRAAHRGACSLDVQKSREGSFFQAGVHQFSSKAPRHEGNLHARLRRIREIHRARLRDLL
jgi:aerobic-type carbon monoxide dehydrogenase small subunit (CoxS/CutS family)